MIRWLMDFMPETSDIIKRSLKSTIDVIGRRSSEDYAIVMVNNAVKKLRVKYDFLRYVEIKNTKYFKVAETIDIKPSINNIEPGKVGKFFQEFIETITKAMVENAGFFFIKELKDTIGPDIETILNNMDVNLDFMQLRHVTDKTKTKLLKIDNSDLLEKVLKALITIMKKETSYDNVISYFNKLIEKSKNQYDFLKYVKIINVRLNMGVDEVQIDAKINDIEPALLGETIEKFMVETNKSLEEKSISSFNVRFKRYLPLNYISKIEELGVSLDIKKRDHELIFKHVIKAIFNVFSKASTQSYAVFAMNTLLRKVDTKYDFLKSIKVNPAKSTDELYDLSIMTNLNEVSELDTRMAIQKLLEEVIHTLGEEIRARFITEFKNSLEKDYLSRMEEMRVNLHMIELKQDLHK